MKLIALIAVTVALSGCSKKDAADDGKPQTPAAICEALLKAKDIVDNCKEVGVRPNHREAIINVSGQPAYAIMIDQGENESELEKLQDTNRAYVKTLDARGRKYSESTSYRHDRKRRLLVTVIGGFDRTADGAPKLKRMFEVIGLDDG